MLELVSLAVFASCLFALFVIYAGYPLLFRILPDRIPKSTVSADPELTIAVVIVARNEAFRIRAKIENLIGQAAAHRLTSIVVVSDHSDDATADIVADMAKTDLRVLLLELTDDFGKAAGLRAGVAAADADIIVFSDVRQTFSHDAIAALCRHFAVPDVGAVCGELRHAQANSVVDAYWKYETSLRCAEARFDSVIGCTGAIYAIRKELFVPPPVGLILDDVWIPMHVVFAGYRVRYEPDAVATEPECTSSANEFRKKIRTLAGNYQLVGRSSKFVSPRENRLWWAFFLHKLARLSGPFWLILAFCSAILIAWPGNLLLVGLQLSAYMLAGLAQVFPVVDHKCRICRLCRSFVVLNAAAGLAFLKALSGQYDDLWDAPPRARGQVAELSGTD